MKEERRVTVLSIGINSLIVFIKIYAGMIFNSYTLISNSYITLCDTVQDFMGFSGSIFRGRRANRREPFGYGIFQNYATIFVGVVISLLGLCIIIKSFFLKFETIDLKVLFVLLILILVKIIFSNYLFKNAKLVQSDMLMTMAHVSFYDAVLIISSIFFIFLASILPVFDLIGSLFMGTILIYKGINVIINSFISLNSQNNQNKRVIKKIENIVKDSDGISYSNCNLINVKNFYKVVIEILIDDDVSLHDLIIWEEYLKSNIKSERINVKYVDFLVYQK